ncbi:DEAD/DEAH box helicase [Mesorhizobium sp. M0601]|uniref:helicase C-terminal domain-containing protein n=2 Tax=Mesorhizobium TaxID=68287 RepID=UPI00333BA645
MNPSTGRSEPTRFQARTIAYVVKRFWEDAEPARRFLVADEVGLGKTMVAREVLAEALRRRPGESIDIVYLCSSQPVASQNLKRLKVHGHGGNTRATRLTLLAAEPPGLNGIRYFALTPDTSFKVTGRSGTIRERALIYRCLRTMFRRTGFQTIMQQVSDRSWLGELERLKASRLDQTVIRAFRTALQEDEALQSQIRDLASEAVTIGSGAKAKQLFKKKRDALVGRLRKELALRSAEAIASNGLVIVDEFQRFASLFDLANIEHDFGVRLAERLLTQDIPERRVLLLSATPYRMPGGMLGPDEKPYADLVALVRFLAGAAIATALSEALDRYARALRAQPPQPGAIIAARDDARAILSKIMCRTERTRAVANAMVYEEARSVAPTASDLGGAMAARRIARRLQVRDPDEYWKSAPFFLDFMRDYQFRDAAIDVAAETDRRFVAKQAKRGQLLLDRQSLKRLDAIAPPSPRLRDLIKDAMPPGVERLLWIPPSLPYLKPGGQFSRTAPDLKRLIFTEWRLAPDAIAALTSYEVEHRLAAGLRASRSTRKRRAESGLSHQHKRFGALGNMLRLGRANQSVGDPTLAMVPLALLLSGPRMAQWGDPLVHAVASGAPVDAQDVLNRTGDKIRTALKSVPSGGLTGRVDDRWYWAAPLLLEGDAANRDWSRMDDPFLAAKEVIPGDLDRVKEAISAILAQPGSLGRRPRDLVRVLAKLAVAGPGNCAYRALSRTAFGPVLVSQLRRGAFHIARGFQSLFNQSEAAAAIQLEHPGRKRVFWDQALDYCVDGNLQSLLDEHLHFEVDGLALFDGTDTKKLEMAAAAVHSALTLRRASIEVSGLERRRNRMATADIVPLRCRHGARFAEVKEADGAVSRLDAVRAAFNSPFRPFILASTAVGQEGLDFHPWCHAVVHWNLPRSPVELEQREGRVHRYKGHAVRLNVARAINLSGFAGALSAASPDPWRTLFDIAATLDLENELSPCWLFEAGPNPTRIRRIIPFLDFSREEEGWPRLRARLATYRLAMGLPRADDLLDDLERNGVTADQAAAWRIDLRPPRLT